MFQEKALTSLENSAQIFNLLSDLPGEINDIQLLLEVTEQNILLLHFTLRRVISRSKRSG